ncbi:MAG TPA: membrane protein FxsA [Nitrospiraceae bacterium]|nr:membrane protein FxsA [Nitrospiraceae bacterium]
MFFKLFLLFAVIPVIELALLIQIGSIIGTFNTIAVVILTAITGAYMVKLEGIGVFYRMQRDMAQGIFPAEELINGVLILVAGALLLTPGFFTDILGFLMVVPGSREVIKKIVKRYIERHTDIRRF